MATRRYKISVGKTQEQIVAEVGAATNSDTVELTINMGTDQVKTTTGLTRAITKAEIFDAIEKLEAFILQSEQFV